MRALEAQGMIIYICDEGSGCSRDDYIYIYIHRYTSMASRSTARLIKIIHMQRAYLANILASLKSFIYYMAHRNIIPAFSCS